MSLEKKINPNLFFKEIFLVGNYIQNHKKQEDIIQNYENIKKYFNELQSGLEKHAEEVVNSYK
jgi:hypothetical protein